MSRFVRKNSIICATTFTANDGSGLQPSTAEAVLVYKNTAGQLQTDTVPLALGADNVWSGSWDSSNAAAGKVEWVITCSGPLQAATEGVFHVLANKANASVA